MKRAFISLLAIFLVGCATLPASTVGSAPKLSENWTKSEEVYPVTMVTINGKEVAMNHVKREIAVNREVVGVKKPFLARVWGWFLGLGVIGGALAFFFPATFFAIILWLMGKWKNLKAQYLLHKTALEETVAGIKESGVVVKGSPVAVALNDATSPATQVLVAQIKAQS